MLTVNFVSQKPDNLHNAKQLEWAARRLNKLIDNCLLNILLVDRGLASKYFIDYTTVYDVDEYAHLLRIIMSMSEQERKSLLGG